MTRFDPLVSILSAMLRAALAWEEEHGTIPEGNPSIDGLQDSPGGIHSGPPLRLGKEGDGHDDADTL